LEVLKNMRCEIESYILNKVINCFSLFSGVSEMTFNDDGLFVSVISPDYSILTRFLLKKELFISYEIEETESVIVDVPVFKQIINKTPKSEVIKLETLDHKLNIEWKKRKYNIPMFVEPKCQTYIQQKTIENLVEVQINKKEFLDILKELKGVDMIEIQLTANENFLSFYGYNDRSDVVIDTEDLVVNNFEKPVSSTYELTSILKIMKELSDANEIYIKFGADTPIQITAEYNYDLDDLVIEYFLAPRNVYEEDDYEEDEDNEEDTDQLGDE